MKTDIEIASEAKLLPICEIADKLGLTEEEAEDTRAVLAAKLGNDVEVTTVCGGQPVYYYFISIE